VHNKVGQCRYLSAVEAGTEPVRPISLQNGLDRLIPEHSCQSRIDGSRLEIKSPIRTLFGLSRHLPYARYFVTKGGFASLDNIEVSEFFSPPLNISFRDICALSMLAPLFPEGLPADSLGLLTLLLRTRIIKRLDFRGGSNPIRRQPYKARNRPTVINWHPETHSTEVKVIRKRVAPTRRTGLRVIGW
jgi:hypothetical protein